MHYFSQRKAGLRSRLLLSPPRPPLLRAHVRAQPHALTQPSPTLLAARKRLCPTRHRTHPRQSHFFRLPSLQPSMPTPPRLSPILPLSSSWPSNPELELDSSSCSPLSSWYRVKLNIAHIASVIVEHTQVRALFSRSLRATLCRSYMRSCRWPSRGRCTETSHC